MISQSINRTTPQFHQPLLTGAGDFQAHFPSSFSGAGTGAAFWLLAGPPSVFRVQV